MREIRQSLLASNGALLLEVPNFYAHDSFELAHLSCFTPHSLKEFLRLAGYEIQAFRKHGHPRSKTLDLYIGALARPIIPRARTGSGTPRTLRAPKRALAMLWRKVITRLRPKDSWLGA